MKLNTKITNRVRSLGFIVGTATGVANGTSLGLFSNTQIDGTFGVTGSSSLNAAVLLATVMEVQRVLM